MVTAVNPLEQLALDHRGLNTPRLDSGSRKQEANILASQAFLLYHESNSTDNTHPKTQTPDRPRRTKS